MPPKKAKSDGKKVEKKENLDDDRDLEKDSEIKQE